MNFDKKTQKIGILGAGRQAAETAGYLVEQGYKIEFFFCEAQYNSENNSLSKIASIITEEDDLSGLSHIPVLSALGSPRLRKRFLEIWPHSQFASFIHSSAWIAQDAKIGLDVTIPPMVIINSNVKIGNHVLINTNCSISHDTTIDEYSTISPGSNIAGRVTIQSGVFIGIGSSIIENLSIGIGAVIAAGAVVVNNIPNNYQVAGVPARNIKKLKEWY